MRSSTAVVLLLALGTGLGAGLAACTDAPADKPKAEPSNTPTPLSSFDTSAVSIARADFCGLVPKSAAELALGAPIESTADYGNGERATIAPDVHDVAHEFSCSWSTAEGTTARAWVFAPPITKKQARAMVRDLKHQHGCSVPDAPAFGKPSVATVCTPDTGVEASYHGLFVDAWLSCSVSTTGSDDAALLDRTGEWCVQVAAAANTR